MTSKVTSECSLLWSLRRLLKSTSDAARGAHGVRVLWKIMTIEVGRILISVEDFPPTHGVCYVVRPCNTTIIQPLSTDMDKYAALRYKLKRPESLVSDRSCHIPSTSG